MQFITYILAIELFLQCLLPLFIGTYWRMCIVVEDDYPYHSEQFTKTMIQISRVLKNIIMETLLINTMASYLIRDHNLVNVIMMVNIVLFVMARITIYINDILNPSTDLLRRYVPLAVISFLYWLSFFHPFQPYIGHSMIIILGQNYNLF